MQPVVCMITDRHRLGGETPDRAEARMEALLGQVAAAARAGAHLVQVRERDLDGGPLLTLVAACLDAVRNTRARVIVNERLDVALAAGAHGVHLRSQSMSASRVRAQVPHGFVIGRSVHTIDEALAADRAGGADYLQLGPVFPTRSKPGAAGIGREALASIADAVRLPVLAVGGVTAATAAGLAAAGAAGFAAVDLFTGSEDAVAAAVSSARRAFDTRIGAP